MPSLIIVDDVAADIMYTGNWSQGGRFPEYHNTTHGTASQGDTATFNFTGTWISVYVSMGDTDIWGIPSLEFAVDGGEPESYTSINISAGQSWHWQAFSSDILDEREHTLVINHTDAGPSTLWLDFLEYLPSSSASSPAPPSESAPTAASEHLSKGSLAGVIVGSVAGTIIILVLLAVSPYH
ncbi:hypothetical protein CONPUDRAFT_167893 [Coniophora puteana RWD-64-598 SS2]|uniref:Uncharacterized protein n=1 Tax=Coniophora puteana (strain RWD-64-598) TaxID=741705 RepID=A0A5M3MGX7_CONPW|nr:uncharacterized protein CONPUDRAFT_167893 [Coniophora puteana RWD-64-598 SS2]EIW77885.1 hypothetical protein CONPUDRAFT_167893 [Coniophora puteana RWD-64-598 SS2]